MYSAGTVASSGETAAIWSRETSENVGRVSVRGSWISALLKLAREGDVTGDRSSCTQDAGCEKVVGWDATWNIILDVGGGIGM